MSIPVQYVFAALALCAVLWLLLSLQIIRRIRRLINQQSHTLAAWQQMRANSQEINKSISSITSLRAVYKRLKTIMPGQRPRRKE